MLLYLEHYWEALAPLAVRLPTARFINVAASVSGVVGALSAGIATECVLGNWIYLMPRFAKDFASYHLQR